MGLLHLERDGFAAGEGIGRAQRYFDDAEASAAAGDYAAALDLYGRAYREVVK